MTFKLVVKYYLTCRLLCFILQGSILDKLTTGFTKLKHPPEILEFSILYYSCQRSPIHCALQFLKKFLWE